MDLLIDDTRTFGVDYIARNYKAGMVILDTKTVEKLYLDFDLGEEKTGLDILKNAAARNILPRIITLVTWNSVGFKQMKDFLLLDAGYKLEDTGEFVKEKEVKYPICPINLYFEGDEGKCDVSKCNWDTETRSCSEHCKINKETNNV